MRTQGPLTFIASVVLTTGLRVRIKAGTTTTPPEVELATQADKGIGVVEYRVEVGDLVSVRPFNLDGSQEFVAAKAIAVGEDIYSAASGKISDSSSGAEKIGVMLEAATADGDLVEGLVVA